MYGKYMWENGDVHLCPWEMTRVSLLWSKIDEKMMIHRWISYGMPYLRFKRYAFIWFYLMPEVRGGLRWQVWWQVRRRWQLDMAMWVAFSVAMKSWWQVWWQNVMANMGAPVFWWQRRWQLWMQKLSRKFSNHIPYALMFRQTQGVYPTLPICSGKSPSLPMPCRTGTGTLKLFDWGKKKPSASWIFKIL